MNFAYPIQAILMYLSILLAPPEVDRITIEPPGGEAVIELVRDGQTWEFEGGVIDIEGDNLVFLGEDTRETIKITNVIALPGDHDWSEKPQFTLGGGNILEKVAAGFTLRRNVVGGDGSGVARIRYHRAPVAAGGLIAVNVLGDVVNQGIHEIRANETVKDAINAAGGSSAGADMKSVTIIRGPAGSVPKVTAVDLTIHNGSGRRIQAGDTIHVPSSGEKDTQPTGRPEVAALAEPWLSWIDAGDHARSWNEAAAFFRKSITVEAWGEAMAKFRKPFGEMKSRKIRDVRKADALPGAPDGKYVIVQFDTSFAAKAEAVETVTFMLEEDGSWKPAGYVIR